MPIQQIRLYDLIVDIVPGIVAIYLMQLLIPLSDLPVNVPSGSGVQLAVILTGAGFLLGRLIHSLSSIFSQILDNRIPITTYPTEEFSSQQRILFELRKSLPIEDDEDVVDDMFAPDWAPSPISSSTLQVKYPYVDFAVIKEIKSNLEEKYGFDPDGAESRSVRHFAYSHLFRSQTLYERYNMLVTFFRNIAFIFWITSLIVVFQSLLIVLNIRIWGVSPWVNRSNSWLLVLFLIFVAIVTSRQLFKFSHRRNRHLVIDLFQNLAEKETSSSNNSDEETETGPPWSIQ